MGSPLPPSWQSGRKPYVRGGSVGTVRTGGLTANQKAVLGLAALLVGPAAFKKYMDTPAEKVDLSSFNIVTKYDVPAIEKRDDTLRIEFCAS